MPQKPHSNFSSGSVYYLCFQKESSFQHLQHHVCSFAHKKMFLYLLANAHRWIEKQCLQLNLEVMILGGLFIQVSVSLNVDKEFEKKL